jgi:KilA-N domain
MNIPNEYKSLSEIAKASEKRLNNWVNRSEGKKAIADFKLKYPKVEYPLVTKQGKGGGTWAHPELAAIFAAWCNPRFTAEVVEQNTQLKEQNALLKEKIRTFHVDTPAQIAARMDEVTEVRGMAHQVVDKGIEEVELIAKCHFAGAIKHHPKGLTFEQYLPHWLYSMSDRTDIYPCEILKEMTIKAGKPIAYQGKILKHGCSHVWIELN